MNAYATVLVFFTMKRTFVTGVSGAPVKGVVLKVASSAEAPVASSATAGSPNGTRFSAVAGSSCAFETQTLHSTTRKAASIFMSLSPSSLRDSNDCLLTNHRIHKLVNRLAVFRHALRHTALAGIARLLENTGRRSVPIKNVRVQTTNIVIG